MNLSVSCYPDRLEYVDQILGFASEKIQAFHDRFVIVSPNRFPKINILKSSTDLHAPQTTNNLASLLLAPINSYQSILTLLALPRYAPLLLLQPFTTRRSLAHAVVSSVLKNETIIETPEDVGGVLDLCQVLIHDQLDSALAGSSQPRRPPASYYLDREEIAEEQGWVARMVHLFRSESLDVQFEVRLYLPSLLTSSHHIVKLLQTARRHFETGGERMRFTYPALITNAIKLCRRYKLREHVVRLKLFCVHNTLANHLI